MKDVYTATDFAKGVRNPYFSKLNRKTEVAIRHDAYNVFSEIAEQNGVTAEMIMQHCLMDYAAELGKTATDVVNESAKKVTIAAEGKNMMKLLSLMAKLGVDTVHYVDEN